MNCYFLIIIGWTIVINKSILMKTKPMFRAIGNILHLTVALLVRDRMEFDIDHTDFNWAFPLLQPYLLEVVAVERNCAIRAHRSP